MENNELELNVHTLEEQEKVATSLEDVYGYKVLTKEFQAQIDYYNQQKKQEQQMILEYVFTEKPKDSVMSAYKAVMQAKTDTVVGIEYEKSDSKGDNVFTIAAFTVLGAFITGLIWSLIERKRKGKKSENYNNSRESYYELHDGYSN